MNLATLDHLIERDNTNIFDKNAKRNRGLLSLWYEILIFVFIFVLVFVLAVVFTNANLFINSLGFDNSGHVNSIINLDDEAFTREFFKKDMIDLNISNREILWYDINSVLIDRIDSYVIDFNILPPVDRLIIDGISLDVPLISETSKDYGDFVNGDFDDELREWVVRYPTTPWPGMWWNTLIFGHTSQERWERNPYGTVFSHLPKLNQGDEIKMVWWWELYKYKVVTTVIRRPRDVDKEFQKRQNMDKEYITLMWCYPLWTTKQRMMVIAERVY